MAFLRPIRTICKQRCYVMAFVCQVLTWQDFYISVYHRVVYIQGILAEAVPFAVNNLPKSRRGSTVNDVSLSGNRALITLGRFQLDTDLP